MADLVLVCRRPDSGRVVGAEHLRAVAERLRPPDLPPQPPKLVDNDGILLAVFNESGAGVETSPGAVLVGGLIGDNPGWDVAGSAPPEGTYALLRFSPDVVEALSDITASRTLWYLHDADTFMISTSQRALVALAGSFELDRRSVAWLMSAGGLGPEGSWDRRIGRLPRDSRLTLDRHAWRLRLDETPAQFEPVARSRREHIGLLREAIGWSCQHLQVDYDRWLVALSGGSDSRVALAFTTKDGRRPASVTWTTRQSLSNPLSDARIALAVAKRLHAEHRFVYLDPAQDGPDAALQRFVEVGEGRVDEYAGYVDGLATWRQFALDGTQGVIRGDEVFGNQRRVTTDLAARLSCGSMALDYPHDHIVRRLGLAVQVWPERLRRRPGERFESYLDRTSQEDYVPTFLAALTELKARYVEVVNPFLSRAVVTLMRTIPEELHMYRRGYHHIADHVAWPVPYARFSSTDPSYVGDPGYVDVMARTLISDAVQEVVTEEGASLILAGMISQGESASVTDRIVAVLKAARMLMPTRLADRLTPRFNGPDPLPASDLAFRATMAVKAIAVYRADAGALAASGLS